MNNNYGKFNIYMYNISIQNKDYAFNEYSSN